MKKTININSNQFNELYNKYINLLKTKKKENQSIVNEEKLSPEKDKLNRLNFKKHLENIFKSNDSIKDIFAILDTTNQALFIYDFYNKDHNYRKASSQSYVLDKTEEYDYRVFNVDDDYYDKNTIDAFIKPYLRDMSDNKHPYEYRIYCAFICSYLDLRSKIANPFTWITQINYQLNRIINPFNHTKDIDYYNFVYDAYNLVNNNFKNDSRYNNIFYKPSDLYLDILNNSADEILMKINLFFDINFNILSKIDISVYILNDLNNLNIELKKMIDNKINEYKRNKHILSDLNFVWSKITILESRKNRDHFFEVLKFLKSSSNKYTSKQYNNPLTNLFTPIDINKKITDEELKLYLNESKVNRNTFNKNINTINHLSKAIKILTKQSKILSPHICIDINPTNILNLKIIYHELFSLKSEHKKYIKDNHKKKLISTDIQTILKTMIITANEYSNFLTEKELLSYGKNPERWTFTKKEYKEDKNEYNNIIYKVNILLSEKIRRGHYREFDISKQYSLIFDYKLELRNILTTIFQSLEIEDMFYFQLYIYNKIENIINNMNNKIGKDF